MTIDKAIKQLTEILEISRNRNPVSDRNAIKLGIEALKAVKYARANNYYTPIALMPGETKD